MVALLGGILAWLGPDIVRDWSIRDAIPAQDGARIEEARCSSWLGALEFCRLTVVGQSGGADGGRVVRYAFIGVSGGEPIALLRSRSDPALITTDRGIGRLWSRLIALLLFCAVPAVGIASAALVHNSANRAWRAFAALSGSALAVVIVEIERKNLVPPRRRLWAYHYDTPAGRALAVVEWPARDRPLFTSEAERWALAVQGEAGGMPLLLDAKLECLDLTEAERTAFYAACHAAFGGA